MLRDVQAEHLRTFLRTLAEMYTYNQKEMSRDALALESTIFNQNLQRTVSSSTLNILLNDFINGFFDRLLNDSNSYVELGVQILSSRLFGSYWELLQNAKNS